MFLKKRCLKQYSVCCCRKKNVFSVGKWMRILTDLKAADSYCIWIYACWYRILWSLYFPWYVSFAVSSKTVQLFNPSIVFFTHCCVCFCGFETDNIHVGYKAPNMRELWSEELNLRHSLPTLNSSELETNKQTKPQQKLFEFRCSFWWLTGYQMFWLNWWLKYVVLVLFFCVYLFFFFF